MATARGTAINVLLRVERDGAYLSLALDEALRAVALGERDRAFCTAIALGTTERRLALDRILSRYVKKPLAKLDAEVLCILRAGLYQLAFMDSVPGSAAVNESVALCRAFKKTSAGGFVNGVLRAAAREREALRSEAKAAGASAPPELLERLCSELGEEAATAFLELSLSPPVLFARVNTTKTTDEKLIKALAAEGVSAERVENLPHALALFGVHGIRELASFQAGLFHIQDISSQGCALALGAAPGDRVLDVCAAPGGKSFTIAQGMENRGTVLSCDIHPHRVALIEQGARRLGLDIIRPTVQNATEYTEWNMKFDSVLCDVPCSGLGIIRRKPEIAHKALVESANLPELQYKILENSSQYLRAGGVLVYSTCTLLKAENEEIVRRFLEEHRDFSPLEREALGGSQKTFNPKRDRDGDGFFVSVIKKQDGAPA